MRIKISFKKQKKESRHNKGSPPGQKRVNKPLKPIQNKINKKNDINNMAKKTFTAICFFPVEQNKKPHKYKNVSTPARLTIYMKRKGAHYINFYDTITKNYEFRLYANDKNIDNEKQLFKEKQEKMQNITNQFTQFINNLKIK